MADEEPVKVRYSRRTSQGFLLGIDTAGMITAGAGILIVVFMFVNAGILQGLISIPVVAPVIVVGLLRQHGISLSLWFIWAAAFKIRKKFGMTKYRRKIDPLEPVVQGVLDLPGSAGRYEVWETLEGVCAIWDRVEQTVSITCIVASPGMAERPDDTSDLAALERQGLVAALMVAAGAWTRRPEIKRVSMQERTRPGTLVAEERALETVRQRGTSEGVADALDGYEQGLKRGETNSPMRPQSLTITLDTTNRAAQATIKGFGGRKVGVLGLVEREIQAASGDLAKAGFTKIAWCSPREWGGWGRGIVDPASESQVDVRLGTAFEGIAPELAGPLSCDEHKDYVETDSAFHRVYWISEWPRLDVLPGFLGKLVYSTQTIGGQSVPVRHTLQVVGTPVPLPMALKRIKKARETWKTNANLTQSRGQHVTIADETDWENLDARERELIAGQGELAFTGYLVASALTLDGLESACASLTRDASTANLELVTLTYQQTAALMAVAYPTGAGMR